MNTYTSPDVAAVLTLYGGHVGPANWHPDLTVANCRLALMKQHGYGDWAAVIASAMPSPAFEAAVEAVVDGEPAALDAGRPARAGHRPFALGARRSGCRRWHRRWPGCW